jgi:hypothetical protein
MGTEDYKKYSNPNKCYSVVLLKTNRNGGYFKSLEDALNQQKKFEASKGYATIIRVDPETKEPLYGSDGYPMAL